MPSAPSAAAQKHSLSVKRFGVLYEARPQSYRAGCLLRDMVSSISSPKSRSKNMSQLGVLCLVHQKLMALKHGVSWNGVR